MNQTIYFRKDVWEDFQNEKDKSRLVNELLSTHYGARTVDSVHVSEKDESISTIDTKASLSQLKTAKSCKHGSDPSLCKFAKPGKKCK